MRRHQRHRHHGLRSTAEKCSEKIIVKESGHSSLVCSELRRQAFGSKNAGPSRVVVQRKYLDALLAGTLQDIFNSQTTWEHVELNASSKWSLRLLEVLSRRQDVRTLVVKHPSEFVLDFLAGWLGNKESNCATVGHVTLGSGTLLLSSALALSEGLSSRLCTITSLEIAEVSFHSWETVEAIAKGLSEHCRLEKVSLHSCHLEDAEVSVLVGALHWHPSLMELRLSMNYCQEEGTLALCRLLRSPFSFLQTLDISYQDNWDDRKYFAHYASALSDARCPLRQLNLASNFVGDEQFSLLLQALQNNTRLEKLQLRDNRITDKGIKEMVQALPQLSSLRRLDVSQNRHGIEVVRDLQESLCGQTALTELVIDYGSQFPRIAYYTALNRAGRYCKSVTRLPLGLWPLIFERSGKVLTSVEQTAGISEADLLFDLLRGPGLLER